MTDGQITEQAAVAREPGRDKSRFMSVTIISPALINVLVENYILCREKVPPMTSTCSGNGQACSMWSKRGEAVILLTCQFFLSFHPSDGGSWLAAHGCAGELRLIPLADHILTALDNRAAWWDWPRRNGQKTDRQHLYINSTGNKIKTQT